MHVFDQKPNFIQIVVKLIITYILIVKYRWPISLKQEILYIIIKSYLAQIYKNTSNQIYIQLGSKCFEFFVSLKIYPLNQSEMNRNMICYPSFNQSYSQLDDFFFKTVTQISNSLCLAEYAGVDVAGTQTATGLGPDYTNRQDAFDKVNFTGFY